MKKTLEKQFKDGRLLVVTYSYNYSHIHGIEDIDVEHAMLIDANDKSLDITKYYTHAELEEMVLEHIEETKYGDECDRAYELWKDRKLGA